MADLAHHDQSSEAREQPCDPRIGDEAATSQLTPPDTRASPPSTGSSSQLDATNEKHTVQSQLTNDARIGRFGRLFDVSLPQALQWIPANFTWSKLKPVIRCATVAWISLIFIVINPTLRVIGQAGFLILIAAFLSPPSDPVIANIERELIIMFMVTLAWAWASLGIKLATLTRSQIISNPSTTAIFNGDYIEASPSIILAAFLFLGSTFFLYIKARQGPGPFVAATVLGCITLDISMQTASLFPYANYTSGQAVVVPLAFHSAIAILCSILIFPLTISAQYTLRLRAVLAPLRSALEQHLVVLATPTSSDAFDPTKARAFVSSAETALAPLRMAARLLKRDVVWHRFRGSDLAVFSETTSRLVIAANGMNYYFALIDPTRERFPITPALSHPGSPNVSRAPSRHGTPSLSHPISPVGSRNNSPVRDFRPSVALEDRTDTLEPPIEGRELSTDALHSQPDPQTPLSALTPSFSEHRGRKSRRRPHFEVTASRPTSRQSRAHSFVQALHLPLLHHHREHVVGVFESHRYLDLESSHFTHPLGHEYTQRTTALLRESVEELLRVCIDALRDMDNWLETSRRHTGAFWRGGERAEKIRSERLTALKKAADSVREARERFKKDRRLRVLHPYRAAFDAKHLGSMAGGDNQVPPHKHLFHCYVYQYHLGRLSTRLLETLEMALELEVKRKRTKFWFSEVAVYKVWQWSIFDHHEYEREDDENPDIVPGVEDMLGEAMRRDPDALPPRNTFERVMNWIYNVFTSFGGGNILFAIKAGILTVVLSIPWLLKSTAAFAYAERFNWAIFMGQLTLARFRGDTSFGLVARIFSTFFGGLVGTAIWYMSTGSGAGSSYGLATVCGIAFPFFFYARLYWPGPPMTNIIFFVTIVLVVGFSWQNTHYHLGTFAYYGINLAWRRFVLVTCGVFAAFIFSFLPPSTTLRCYKRNLLSTTITETGAAYCRIVSFANAQYSDESTKIVQTLIAIRLKLKRSVVMSTNIAYEFSLRGRWPAERYNKIADLQLEIGYLLSHLLSVAEHLEPVWSHAFLRRTRFLDADFQGDVLAIITLIGTALRAGIPLPQITPCPLLDKFMLYQHGLNIIRHEADDDYGLPRTMTIDTLENEQYMMFCVGVSTAFGIVTRLDRLMVASKELVGEQYHIHGVGFVSKVPAVELTSRTSSLRPTSAV